MWSDPLYLLEYLPATPDNASTATWKISGSTRNVYTITLHPTRHRMFCDCPDMRSHAARHRVVCKHILFVLMKVARFTEANLQSYFGSLVLSPEQEAGIQEAMGRGVHDRGVVDDMLLERFQKMTVTAVTVKEQALDARPISETDECPICYDVLLNETRLDHCRACRNSFHDECMKKWMQYKTTCAYCRVDLGKKSGVAPSEYIQL